MASYRACEVCSARDAHLLLRSPRLDGPLVRCPHCGLVYIGARKRDFTFATTDPERTDALADQVHALGLVSAEVERAETPWRAAAESERLARLRRYAPEGGRLLDVGASVGDFLTVVAASGAYRAEGVEPDPGTAARARDRGLEVRTGTLDDVPLPPEGEAFDAITMFHVLEHLDSPRAALIRARALLRPEGVLLLETPTVENPWFRLAPGRWRQLIPDHYFFFSRATLDRLLRETGFEPVDGGTVARRVSLRFAADRLRRAGVPGAGGLAALVERAGIAERSVRLDPRDILTVTATAPPPGIARRAA